MMNKIVWRLKEQPTSEMLRELVKDNLLTKEEAREILFNSVTEEDRDKESLKSEIKFLRELAEKLSQNNNKVVEIIREIERPWRRYQWYDPYMIWCNAVSGDLTGGSCGGDTLNTLTGKVCSNFSSIKTF